ncbi:VOC family protein [Denitromonas iodatirespirans]|uniref:VOC family protein n=1 Tax=Denitromonas iodatirespirans TaxID=2795389 RepID=A0A944H892_DENI1|nr:VOC family protein [Denitromonas iodatirespirans]MBT0961974.1 VOC family protein [Denitromonas iodatirespirans]
MTPSTSSLAGRWLRHGIAAAALAAAWPAAQADSVPGMRGVEHFGFTVPDAQQAVDFFVGVMGCKAFFTIGPFGPFKDNWMKENLNVNPRAVIPVAHLVRCGNGTNFEIFEYTSPDQKIQPPKNSDVGGHHIAFYVDDLKAAMANMRAKGVKFLGEPHLFTEGPLKGLTWIYFMSPWGMQLELVTAPEGRGYEQTMRERLWDPRQ